MHQSNGIQLSPEDTAIAAACFSQATVRDSKGNPRHPADPLAGRRSIAHVGTDVHVIAANDSIFRVVIPKATKVKAAVSPEGWIAYASWLNTGSWPIAPFTTTWVPGACGEPRADRVRVQLDRPELRGRDSGACTPVRTFGCRRKRVLGSGYLVRRP
ncbi:hypothetical protein C8R44DRAFT_748450 [Mycena epipterygia]|nr:hypothetical protein C8R44DRAFT_748450 [Mycena epipterygia]